MGPFTRRLWVRHKRSGRDIRRRMESVLPTMTVSSILEEPFAGDPFPGHDRINHSLADLQVVVSQARADWRIALASMKGVYVIHDQETGKGGRRVLPDQHAVCSPRVLVDAYRRRPCPGARVILEGRASCTIAGTQQKLTDFKRATASGSATKTSTQRSRFRASDCLTFNPQGHAPSATPSPSLKSSGTADDR